MGKEKEIKNDVCNDFEDSGDYHYNKWVCRNCGQLKHNHKDKQDE